MKDYRQLKAWQKAHQVCLDVYRLTRKFPSDERFGLTSQVRRAAVSVGSNLAEGCSRDSSSDFKRFLQIGFGSANETSYLMLVGRDLGYLPRPVHAAFSSSAEEVRRMLISLILKLRGPVASF